MKELNISQLSEIIDHVFLTGIKVPLFVWGPVGVGKSSSIAQSAERHGAIVIDRRLSCCDPVDLLGAIAVRDGQSFFHPPGWLPLVGSAFADLKQPIFLVLDEMNTASPQVLNTALELCLDRRVGGVPLLDNVTVIAAGNRASDGATVSRLSSALANRFMHVSVEPDPDEWVKYAIAQDMAPEVIAFVLARRDSFHAYDPKSKDEAFPTPRAWERVSDVFKNIHAGVIPSAVGQRMICGLVGHATGSEYMAFQGMAKKVVPVDEILANPTDAPLPAEGEPDVAWATVANLGYVFGKKKTKDIAEKAMTYAERLPRQFSYLLVQMMLNTDKLLVSKTAAFKRFASAHADMFLND